MAVTLHWPDHEHRHFRDDGRGYVSHRHPVRSERHGHPAIGLAFTLLTWRWAGWRRARGAAVYVGTVALYVGLAAAALVGLVGFVRVIR